MQHRFNRVYVVLEIDVHRDYAVNPQFDMHHARQQGILVPRIRRQLDTLDITLFIAFVRNQRPRPINTSIIHKQSEALF
jgi:hypothetical protein